MWHDLFLRINYCLIWYDDNKQTIFKERRKPHGNKNGTVRPGRNAAPHGYGRVHNGLLQNAGGQSSAPHGYEMKSLVKGIWHGVNAMVRNDGHCSNEDAFWEDFAGIYGEQSLQDIPLFNEFYANEFKQAKRFCGYNPKAAETVRWIKDRACASRWRQTRCFRQLQLKPVFAGQASSRMSSNSTPHTKTSAGASPISTITGKFCAGSAWRQKIA